MSVTTSRVATASERVIAGVNFLRTMYAADEFTSLKHDPEGNPALLRIGFNVLSPRPVYSVEHHQRVISMAERIYVYTREEAVDLILRIDEGKDETLDSLVPRDSQNRPRLTILVPGGSPDELHFRDVYTPSQRTLSYLVKYARDYHIESMIASLNWADQARARSTRHLFKVNNGTEYYISYI